MLVVTRKIDQSIIATHPDGTVTSFKVLDVNGKQISIGIDAPRCVTVHRNEIQERVDAERKSPSRK